MLVHRVANEWTVASILDWECAGSGSPLCDIGVFLLYEHAAGPVAEPHFSGGFVEAGGHLDDDWSRLVRVLDLKNLCRILAGENLPQEIAREVVDLVAATAADVVQP